ncbi:methyltransferase, FxLD system [Saccharopolyspora shandongensis]|uniref:methyltransferase, FxLD system n=1 Tax=Saccharopolyspora shandongensis TaxID=418495 RepID=UPI00341ECD8E
MSAEIARPRAIPPSAELVGPTGEVTTVDVDPDIVDRATRFLTAAGKPQVAVVLADAEHGVPDHAPYDRVIVTVGAWDIPPAWTDQLVEGGRLVVPLRLRGLTRSVALDRADGHWASVEHQMCGFVPIQGAGAHHECTVALHDDIRPRIDDDFRVDTEGLRTSVLEPAVQRWSAAEVGSNEPFDGLHLWLATAISSFGRLVAEQTAVDNGLVDRMARWNTPTAVHGASFAYLATLRPNTDNTRHEFGVRAHGPDAEYLADAYVELIQTWDRCYRHQQARIDVHPATAEPPQPPTSRVINKQHTRIVLHWPEDVAAMI